MSAPAVIDRVKRNLVGLKMPRALEILDVSLRGIERGETTALAVLDILLTEEFTLRETGASKWRFRWPSSPPSRRLPTDDRDALMRAWRGRFERGDKFAQEGQRQARSHLKFNDPWSPEWGPVHSAEGT